MGMNGSQGIVEGCMPNCHKGINLIAVTGDRRVSGDIQSVSKKLLGSSASLYLNGDFKNPVGYVNPDGSKVLIPWY